MYLVHKGIRPIFLTEDIAKSVHGNINYATNVWSFANKNICTGEKKISIIPAKII